MSRERLRARAAESFRFTDYEGLVMPTGLRAANLREFIDHLYRVTPEVVYHHLYRTPLRHRFGSWDYPNDFAQWSADGLEDLALAEKLAAVDPYALRELEQARQVIADLVEEHLDELPHVPWSHAGFEFQFASGHYLALPGEREVHSLPELRAALAEVPLSSIFYHFHEARLRGTAEDTDDFSRWIEGQYGTLPLTRNLRTIDFYFFSLEDLRQRILHMLDRCLAGEDD